MQSGATRAIDLGLLETLVGYGVRRLQLKVFDDFLRSLRPWSMTPARFSALVIIEKNPDLKLTELARVLGVARSGAVTLVDALEEPGYVARHASPTDGRAFGLRITAKGKNALAKMSAAVEAHDRRMTAALSVAERVQLKELLDRVLDSESKWEATEDAR
ncbi:MAG: MarR family winged helix-turn-helix transcriptional regulator [Myxococcales bacterium]|nr:MarR family winged helix-turn-helix transcriptional regulator [Myxococcales bacterium]